MTSNRALPAVLINLLLSSTLLLTACGSSADTEATVKRGRITVVLSEYRIKPNRILAPPGVLEIKAVNRGALAHNLLVMDGDRLIARTPTFQKGSRVFRARLRPGTYTMASNLGKDRELGVRGTITVR